MELLAEIIASVFQFRIERGLRMVAEIVGVSVSSPLLSRQLRAFLKDQ